MHRVLIVGGGIAGLTLATALRRDGGLADVVERSAEWAPVGGGIAVQPNAMRVLHRLGLGSALEDAGRPLRRWRFRDQGGDVLCEIDLRSLWGDAGPFIGIERTHLQNALLSSGLPCRLGTLVTSLEPHASGVSVLFSDGCRGEYDLVVGADGIHSSLRSIISDEVPVYGGQMVWRSVAPVRAADPDAIEFWLGDGCFYGLCPVGADRTYGFANVTQPRIRDHQEGRLDRLQERFSGFGASVQDHLAHLAGDDAIHCSPIEWLTTMGWGKGRILLIGDAAHACSPMMGQGGSMAIEDAIVLAESLRTSTDLDTATATFIDRRTPRVQWVRQQSEAVGAALGLPPTVRNATLAAHGEQGFRSRYEPLLDAP